MHVVTWFPPRDLPGPLRNDPETSYTVVLARNAAMTDLYKNYTNIHSHAGNVVVFDIPMDDIEPGRQFFMAVKVSRLYLCQTIQAVIQINS